MSARVSGSTRRRRTRLPASSATWIAKASLAGAARGSHVSRRDTRAPSRSSTLARPRRARPSRASTVRRTLSLSARLSAPMPARFQHVFSSRPTSPAARLRPPPRRDGTPAGLLERPGISVAGAPAADRAPARRGACRGRRRDGVRASPSMKIHFQQMLTHHQLVSAHGERGGVASPRSQISPRACSGVHEREVPSSNPVSNRLHVLDRLAASRRPGQTSAFTSIIAEDDRRFSGLMSRWTDAAACATDERARRAGPPASPASPRRPRTSNHRRAMVRRRTTSRRDEPAVAKVGRSRRSGRSRWLSDDQSHAPARTTRAASDCS